MESAYLRREYTHDSREGRSGGRYRWDKRDEGGGAGYRDAIEVASASGRKDWRDGDDSDDRNFIRHHRG